ncbi:UDP-N-acetyl-D-mannosamine dehydrogenase [Alloalcanivorax profundimaris]|uniref:UDP-N-acetyl-D-mannosamine dehydrogenase n=1 Tax=Alloalcanivorax profundimaris TaxID=2735259 RepID=UPI001887C21D|nr:UDP-N-acetyl-D-mannosamine dehydrogenase [Alloalcanivorax profundimaris]MBF1801811.1 UDP-N-acetyl-D-mannosamine dehydrogenase [Alloalcanivorax profundimaris]
MRFDTICVVGLGYIGLPTAAMFASRRKKVIGVDINQDAVETINRGEIHIDEPELDITVRAAVREGYLLATTRPEPAQAFLVAVPTPFKKGQKEGEIPTPDLSYIKSAADSIAPVLEKGNLVILESTSPVGATEILANWLKQARPDLTFPQCVGEDADINLAHCPERVLPGRIMHELVENDRIVGGMTSRCSAAACNLYKTFVRGDFLITDAKTAEMAKLTENAFRDVNIAFANELSMICDRSGIDVWELISMANRHPRVNILQPGPGVGGHCIAVDPWFIASNNPDQSNLITAARRVNSSKPAWVVKKIMEMVDKISAGAAKKSDINILCLGATYKADVGDMRESPSLEIINNLAAIHEGSLYVCDPHAKIDGSNIEGHLVDIEEGLSQADIVVVLVAHKEFRDLDFNGKQVLDVAGMLQSIKKE